jgi:cytochrome P450
METANELERGSVLFGHARAFRTRRIGFLLHLARSAPDVARIRLGAIPISIVSSPELAHALLVENADQIRKSFLMSLFAAPLLGDGLLRLEQGAHKRRRRMVAPAFMPRRITGYASEMVKRAQRSSARMLELGRVDISEESMRLTMDIVGKTLFGAEIGDSAEEVGERSPTR